MRIVIGGILLVVGCVVLVMGLVGAGLFGVVIGTEPGIDKAMHNLVGCVMALVAIAIGWSLFRGRSGNETE
jgi:phosphotransferase system  glucose/maltose/N-acetylglucosamine-specific IIC component